MIIFVWKGTLVTDNIGECWSPTILFSFFYLVCVYGQEFYERQFLTIEKSL